MEDKQHHAEVNEKKWDERAETFERKWFNRFNYFQFVQKQVIRLLDLHEGQNFLDIGCGTGWAVRYAASVVHGKSEFYGIDISPKMIEKAREYCESCENIHFHKADAEALPFENDFFDFIICTNSFHHYFSPSKALAEVCRVLKPGGRFFLLDFTADGSIIKIADKWALTRDRAHVRFYSTQEYRVLFAQSGLNYICSKSVWRPVMWQKVHIASKS
jgi:ubiquinone/menaquinone biosynthesis C-methylase UbiE